MRNPGCESHKCDSIFVQAHLTAQRLVREVARDNQGPYVGTPNITLEAVTR